MNKIKYTLFIPTLAFLLSSCVSDIKSEFHDDTLAVRFKTTISNTTSRSVAGSFIPAGRNVKISNGGTFYNYSADDNGNLIPTDGDFIRWKSSSQTSMHIMAYTPTISNASNNTFTLSNLTSQSTIEDLTNADYANYIGQVSRISGTENVNFELQRRMTQINVCIADIDDRYTDTENDHYSFDITVYSPSTAITVSADTVSGDNIPCVVTPLGGTGVSKGAKATAIITPGEASTHSEFIAVQVKKNGNNFGLPLIASGRTTLLPGHSYTFNLTILYDALTIGSMQMTDWVSTEPIIGGEALINYTVINIDDYDTADEIYDKIKSLCESQYEKNFSLVGSIGDKDLGAFFGKNREDNQISEWLPIECLDLSGITDMEELPSRAFGSTDPNGDGIIPNGMSKLKKISLPDVSKIGSKAFCGCTSLRTIDIPHTVTYIDSYAFTGCISLSSIVIPDCVETINVSGFSLCSGLKSITIPPSLKVLQTFAFYGCTNIKEVHISDLAKWCEISANANQSNPLCYGADLFLNGKKITDLVIPNHVTKIGIMAFYGCTSITSLNTSDYLTHIEYGAFSHCINLRDISISSSVIEIRSGAFNGCIGLTSATVPKSVKKIDRSLFSGCTNLASIKLGAEILDADIFNGCTNLTSIELPNVLSFTGDSFNGCNTENIDLILSSSQKNNISGTTLSYTIYGCDYSYTFKSITFE